MSTVIQVNLPKIYQKLLILRIKKKLAWELVDRIYIIGSKISINTELIGA